MSGSSGAVRILPAASLADVTADKSSVETQSSSSPSGRSIFFEQLRLMLWKNWLLKMHRPIGTACEFIFPMIVMCILIPMYTGTNEDIFFEAQPLTSYVLPERVTNSLVSFTCSGCNDGAFEGFVNAMSRVWTHETETIDSNGTVEYEPYDPVIRDPDQYQGDPYFRGGYFHPIHVDAQDDTDDEFAHWIREFDEFVENSIFDSAYEACNPSGASLSNRSKLLCDVFLYAHGGFYGVEVQRGANDEWSYRIRNQISLSSRRPPSLSGYILEAPTTGYAECLDRTGSMDSCFWHTATENIVWLESVAFVLQYAAETFILEHQSGQTVATPKLSMRLFPNAPFHFSFFLNELAQWILAPFIVLTFVYPFMTGVVEIVTEKESRIKEGMKIMGLSSSVFWCSWAITMAIPFYIISMLSFVIGGVTYLSSGPVYEAFFLYLVFPWSIIAFACMFSTFFNKSSRTSLVVFIVFVAVGCTWYAVVSSDVGFGVRLAASLVPTNALTLGLLDVAYDGKTQFSVGTAIGMLVLDAVMYALLTYYFDAVFPSEFGVQRHPLFFLDPIRNLCRGSSSGVDTGGSIASADSRLLAESNEVRLSLSNRSLQVDVDNPKHNGVAIRHLYKNFGSLEAVVDLSLEMYPGQVFGLLGHNGAGKTTVINMLTGMYQPSKGTAFIGGRNIKSDMHNIRKSMGVCPQFDILWPNLSVREHLEIYANMKGIDSGGIEERIVNLVNAVGLGSQVDFLSGSLSGGQKRKLSFAISMVANPKVVFLDEPTAGMDPESRREIWDLIQKFKAGRVVVLTTHLMDEADLLSDRIGVLSAGELLACGSPTFLKQQFGHGFTLTVSTSVDKDAPTVVEEADKGDHEAGDGILRCVESHAQDCRVVSRVDNELIIQLPYTDSSKLPDLFDELENRKKELGVQNYGISETTLEDVFLTILARQELQTPNVLIEDDQIIDSDEHNAQANNKTSANGNFVSRVVGNKHIRLDDEADELADPYAFAREKFAHQGDVSFYRHFVAMLKKRYHCAKRTWTSILCQLVIPVATLALTLYIIDLLAYSQNDQSLERRYGLDEETRIIMQGPELEERLQFSRHMWPAEDAEWRLNDDYDMPITERNRPLEQSPESHGAVRFEDTSGVPADGSYGGRPGFRAYGDRLLFAPSVLTQHFLPVVMNELNTARLRTFSDSDGANIQGRYKEYPPDPSDAQVRVNAAIQAIAAVSLLVFVNALAPSSAMYFIVKEVQCGAKHLQVVNGVSVAAFWLANFVVDSAQVLVPTLGLFGVLVGFDVESLTTTENGTLGAMLLLLVLAPLANVAFVYACSFLFSDAGRAQTRIIVMLVFIPILTAFIILLIMLPYLLGVSEDQPDLLETSMVFAIIPQNAYVIAVVQLLIPVVSGGDQDGSTWDILAPQIGILAAEIVFYMAITLGFEYYRAMPRVAKYAQPWHVGRAEEVDDDVQREKDRLKAEDASDMIRINGLCKDYLVPSGARGCCGTGGKLRKTAVRNIWFGVPQGQCFGFLGVNGAGKTSTLKMLTGDIRPTAGDSFLGKHSINTNLAHGRRLIGNCPQFDPIFAALTPREHLELFARIKGVTSDRLPALIAGMVDCLRLGEYTDRPAGTLSGGNKRKLSVAMSLIGSPSIVFLDEPSTGLDPRARRFMWNFIRNTMTDRSVILTTHSMEECEALCSRIGIMVAGDLRCIGTSQYLKDKFAQGHELTVTVEGVSASQSEVDALEKRVTSLFSDASLLETQGDHVKFRIPPQDMRLSEVFRSIETMKSEMDLEAYSLTQTTLEQVFLHHARANNHQ